jgi:hypothetical protein
LYEIAACVSFGVYVPAVPGCACFGSEAIVRRKAFVSSCLLGLVVVAWGCSIDTRPSLLSEIVQPAMGAGSSAPEDPRPGSTPGNTAGTSSSLLPAGTSGEGGKSAGAAGTAGNDQAGAAGMDGAAGAAGNVDPGAAGSAGEPSLGEPPSNPDESSLSDELRDLIAANPRVAEAIALRRIMDALDTPRGTAPDVADALDALGDVDCRRNARTCVSVCGWAVSNCSYCANDAVCVGNLQENCNLMCR